MNSGVAGDMFAGALCDLTGGYELLREKLAGMLPGEFETSLETVKRCGIAAKKFRVTLKEHRHHGQHHHGEAHHHHRHLSDIREILAESVLSEKEKALALRIFERVARAEAKAHGCGMDEVHFHEVGAVDSIVDIVSAAVLVTLLAPDRVIASPFCEGQGFVHCAHGEMPLPAPATANILAEVGAPLVRTELPFELTTPTGAAIVAELATEYGAPPMRIKKIGLGAGDRELERPNLVRLFLCEGEESEVLELSCNLDDCTGERLAYTQERLLGAGALDCFFTPVMMKKSRPAYELTLLCTPEKREGLIEILFSETTTIGVREHTVTRCTMERERVLVRTAFGPLEGKRCTYRGIEKLYPEYESAAEAAREHGVPLAAVYEAFLKGEME